MRDIVIEKQISPFGFLIYKECRRKHSCISMFVSVAQWINWTTSFRVPYLWFINLLRIGFYVFERSVISKFFTQFNGFFSDSLVYLHLWFCVVPKMLVSKGTLGCMRISVTIAKRVLRVTFARWSKATWAAYEIMIFNLQPF